MTTKHPPGPPTTLGMIGLDQGQEPGRAGSDRADRVKRKQSFRRKLATGGRTVTVSLEDAFWNALKEIAVSKNTSRPKLVGMIDQTRNHPNLSSGVRLFVLDYYRSQCPSPDTPPARR